MSHEGVFKRLVDWMQKGGGRVGPLDLKASKRGGRNLTAKRKILKGEEVLYIPRHMQLHYDYDKTHSGLDANMGLDLEGGAINLPSGEKSEAMRELLRVCCFLL